MWVYVPMYLCIYVCIYIYNMQYLYILQVLIWICLNISLGLSLIKEFNIIFETCLHFHLMILSFWKLYFNRKDNDLKFKVILEKEIQTYLNVNFVLNEAGKLNVFEY